MTGKKSGVTANPKRSLADRQGFLLLPTEAADVLGVTERQVWRLLNKGAIPKTYVGSLVRVHPEDLNAYIDQQRGEVAAR